MGFRMQTAAFYLIPSRFWQLMTGALCFELTSSARTPSDEPQPEGIPVLIWLAAECGVLALLLFSLLSARPLNMSAYGFPSNRSKDLHMTFYFELGARVRALMDRPGCRLGIHWRNFWNACGDPARYVWMKSPQAISIRICWQKQKG